MHTGRLPCFRVELVCKAIVYLHGCFIGGYRIGVAGDRIAAQLPGVVFLSCTTRGGALLLSEFASITIVSAGSSWLALRVEDEFRRSGLAAMLLYMRCCCRGTNTETL